MGERKYRQRGYQDEERGRSTGRTGPSPAQEPGRSPRSRGLGRPEHEVFRCRDCGQEAAGTEVGPGTACARCGAALHACVNCRSFDPSARWECRAAIAAPVRSKTKANDCVLYAPKTVLELGTGSKDSDPRAAFDALFGKP
jgi:hypothetical protein